MYNSKKQIQCKLLLKYYIEQCVTLTFAERNRLSLSLSGNKPLSAN